jgi:hypothetical protein
MSNELKALVVDQQLEIRDLKNKLEQHETDKRCIVSLLVSIGGGLNDNVLMYDYDQKQELRRICSLAENGLEYVEEGGYA